MTDYYAVLEVPQSADAPTLLRAYRRRAKEAHPDAGGTNEEMALVNEAWRVLRDADARRIHDASLPKRAPMRPSSRNIPVTLRTTTMPFGKHRGEPFDEITSDYLRWVLRKATHAGPDVKKAIHEELDRRRAESPGVQYVSRSEVIHLSLGGDPPLCGSWWKFRPSDRFSTTWPSWGRACKKGCFK